MATPTNGGVPITSFVWGDNAPDVYTLGGLLYGVGLKGLIYSLVAKDAQINNGVPSLMN